MSFPTAEEPARPVAAAPDEERLSVEPDREPGPEAEGGADVEGVPEDEPETAASAPPETPVSTELTEKPVLEWTTEDWARWIEEPAVRADPTPAPAPEPARRPPIPEEAPAPAVEADRPEADVPAGPASEEEVEGEATPTWFPPLENGDDDEADARWWSSVAGLVDPPPAVSVPVGDAVLDEPEVWADAVDEPTSSLTAPQIPPAPPTPAPPTPMPPAPPEDLRQSPAPAAPPHSRRHSLEPDRPDNKAVRVRAGISLLGVSILVGAVTAGLITVAIFLAGVVLRRALG